MLQKRLCEFISSQYCERCLDIWAGKGHMALLAASYGLKVDAVDPQVMKKWRFPSYLINHPLIQFYPITIETFVWDKQYDLILCSNVLMFFSRRKVFGWLLPQIYTSLSSKGILLISFLNKEDPSMRIHNHYELSDFLALEGRNLLKYDSHRIEEEHPPLGKHQHLVYTLLLQKDT